MGSKGRGLLNTGPLVHTFCEPITADGNNGQAVNSGNGSVQAFCAVHRSIGPKTARELMRRGLLHLNGVHWRYGDNSNHGVTRSLNDLDWKYSHTRGRGWHELIGLSDVVKNDRREVMLVIEGSKDALAAAEIARRKNTLHEVGILAALGSGYRPIASELEKLRDRIVMVIGDNDAAGRNATQIVSNELTDVKVEHSIWNWGNDKSKDLYECLTRLDAQSTTTNGTSSVVEQLRGSVVEQLSSFSPPSGSSTVQRFSGSTTQRQQLGEDELLRLIEPFIVTEKGTGNAKSFDLARAIKPKHLSPMKVDQIFGLWFAKSRPMLPPDADQAKSVKHFYRQLKRVRFTESGLSAAIERAGTSGLPDIPSLAHNEHAIRLAALNRELQREAGDRPYICPVNIAQEFLKLRWPSQANYLQHMLEDEQVLECVQRGAPNKTGVKGKPTFWRYKLPMED
jgi:hypothetical protein